MVNNNGSVYKLTIDKKGNVINSEDLKIKLAKDFI